MMEGHAGEGEGEGEGEVPAISEDEGLMVLKLALRYNTDVRTLFRCTAVCRAMLDTVWTEEALWHSVARETDTFWEGFAQIFFCLDRADMQDYQDDSRPYDYRDGPALAESWRIRTREPPEGRPVYNPADDDLLFRKVWAREALKFALKCKWAGLSGLRKALRARSEDTWRNILDEGALLVRCLVGPTKPFVFVGRDGVYGYPYSDRKELIEQHLLCHLHELMLRPVDSVNRPRGTALGCAEPEMVPVLLQYAPEEQVLQNLGSGLIKLHALMLSPHAECAHVEELLRHVPEKQLAQYDYMRLYTPLHYAVRLRRPSFVGLLLQHATKQHVLQVASRGRIALHFADTEGAALLLQHAPEEQVLSGFNQWDEIPLHAADVGKARLLLQHKPELQVLQKEELGRIPLHFAVVRGETDLIELLLKYEPERQLCMPDDEGQTALHYAVARGSKQILGLLLRKCTSMTPLGVAEKGGLTPLRYAALYGKAAIRKRLEAAIAFLESRAAGRPSVLPSSSPARRGRQRAPPPLSEQHGLLVLSLVLRRAGDVRLLVRCTAVCRALQDLVWTDESIWRDVADTAGLVPAGVARAYFCLSVKETGYRELFRDRFIAMLFTTPHTGKREHLVMVDAPQALEHALSKHGSLPGLRQAFANRSRQRKTSRLSHILKRESRFLVAAAKNLMYIVSTRLPVGAKLVRPGEDLARRDFVAKHLLRHLPEKLVLARQPGGKCALHSAVPTVTALLLRHVPERQVMMADDDQQIPLHTADWPKAALLLRHAPRRQVQFRDKFGRVPLHDAGLDTARELLRYDPGEQVLIRCKELGQIPLHNADIDKAELLLQHMPEKQVVVSDYRYRIPSQIAREELLLRLLRRHVPERQDFHVELMTDYGLIDIPDAHD